MNPLYNRNPNPSETTPEKTGEVPWSTVLGKAGDMHFSFEESCCQIWSEGFEGNDFRAYFVTLQERRGGVFDQSIGVVLETSTEVNVIQRPSLRYEKFWQCDGNPPDIDRTGPGSSVSRGK
jgi:hypothetical protein